MTLRELLGELGGALLSLIDAFWSYLLDTPLDALFLDAMTLLGWALWALILYTVYYIVWELLQKIARGVLALSSAVKAKLPGKSES